MTNVRFAEMEVNMETKNTIIKALAAFVCGVLVLWGFKKRKTK